MLGMVRACWPEEGKVTLPLPDWAQRYTVKENWVQKTDGEAFAAGIVVGRRHGACGWGATTLASPCGCLKRVLRNPQRRYSTNRPRHGSNSRDSDEKPALFD